MGRIKTFGCIGEHLSHSFSKEIHAKIGEYDYQIEEVARENIEDFIKARDFSGINVTIPYKQTVIPFLDVVDKDALSMNSVNTVVNKGGRLFGFNTDVFGMTALINKSKIEIAGKKVLILGTGGTSKTAFFAAKCLGAREILLVSRTEKPGAITYDTAMKDHSDTQIIINTTPVGMFPDIMESPISLDAFPKLSGVVDVIYNPLRTRLVCEATARGIRATGGLYMLVAQAVAAAEHFGIENANPQKITKIYAELLKEKENIVLIGMPACGKTTVGKALSGELSFDFVDTDTEIEKEYKMFVPEIFEKKGEPTFRNMESEIIRSVAALSHTVIATGGGAVLRKENIDMLKMNGKLFFLNRDLKYLLPTPDRPTANTKEQIENRFRERYGIYKSAADFALSIGCNPKTAINKIIKKRDNFYENTCD